MADHAHNARARALDHYPLCASWRGGVLLVALCLSVFLPGLFLIPPVDRDESRFAQASRQMHESGDWIVPRVQDRPRLNKPPLIYWLQATSAMIFGDSPPALSASDPQSASLPSLSSSNSFDLGNIWVYRVPSVMCATLTVLLTWRLGFRVLSPKAALLAAAMLCVCPMLVWDAHQARADQLLVLTVVAAQFCLYQLYARSSSLKLPKDSKAAQAAAPAQTSIWIAVLGLWFSIGAGVLTKGPITPLVVIMTVLGIGVTTGRWRWIRSTSPVLGVLIVTAMVAPWVALVASRVGWSSYLQLISNETIGRSAEPAEGHWGPPGYHLALLCVLFWPGVMLTAAAIAAAWRGARVELRSENRSPRRWLQNLRLTNPDAAPQVFLLMWIIPTWIVFELISTKLPHYTLVVYPAIALLSAKAIIDAASGQLPGLRTMGTQVGLALWGMIGIVALVGGLAGLLWLQSWQVEKSTLVLASVGAFAAVVSVVFAWLEQRAGRFDRAMFAAIGGMAVWCIVLLQFVLPSISTLWISPRLHSVINSISADPRTAIALVGYQEDSMIFLSRGRAQRVTPDHLDIWIKQHRQAIVAIQRTTSPVEPETLDALELVGDVSGLNYSTGKRVHIDVYRKGKP